MNDTHNNTEHTMTTTLDNIMKRKPCETDRCPKDNHDDDCFDVCPAFDAWLAEYNAEYSRSEA